MKINFWITQGIALFIILIVGQMSFANTTSSQAITSPQLATPSVLASWVYHPQTFEQAVADAETVVLAVVVAVNQGEDIVIDASEEPEGEVRYPTQRVTLRVITPYSANIRAGTSLELFQTGGTIGSTPFILSGDPLYRVGDKHLLLLVEGPNNMLRVISPEGRYLVENGNLTPTVINPVTESVRARGLNALENSVLSGE